MSSTRNGEDVTGADREDDAGAASGVEKAGDADTADLELVVTSTASAGFEQKNTHLHDLQIHPETLDAIPAVSEGEFLKLTAEHDDAMLEFYGRVEVRDDRFDEPIGRDEIAVGIHCRRGLAVESGDVVTVGPGAFEPIGPRQRLMNRSLKFRPAACRVRKSLSPDSGYKVCRLQPEVKDLIGIEWGDRVVVQSANGRLRGVKALPVRDTLREKYRKREAEKPEWYPPAFTTTAMADRVGIVADLPTVYLGSSARDDLGLRDGGTYQPVKIHRDTGDVFVRLFDKLAIPVVLGAATIVVAFDISTGAKIAVLCVALVVALWSISLHGRRVLLE